ncbi:MAG TPA: flagellar biosynthesis protein FliQ [Rhodothermales bacterium]
MNTDVALFWVQESLKMAGMMTFPLLGTALVVGLIISLFQAVTSLQEMTLSYVPKMLAVALVLLILTPWMLEMMTDFTTQVIHFIPSVSR